MKRYALPDCSFTCTSVFAATPVIFSNSFRVLREDSSDSILTFLRCVCNFWSSSFCGDGEMVGEVDSKKGFDMVC